MADALFNALTAPEFKQIVIDSILRAFDETGEFASHITFPKVSWDFRLELKVYPSPIPEHTVLARGVIEKEPVSIEQSLAAKVITFQQKEGIDTPDLAREQAGLPIPTQAKGADGVQGDVAVFSPRVPEPAPVKISVKTAMDPAPIPEHLSEALESTIEEIVSTGDEPVMTEAQKDEFYAAVRTPDVPARSVSIATRANEKGVKLDAPARRGK